LEERLGSHIINLFILRAKRTFLPEKSREPPGQPLSLTSMLSHFLFVSKLRKGERQREESMVVSQRQLVVVLGSGGLLFLSYSQTLLT